jgi:predicted dehydrogenase/nucleoside-diphosphate-sugar epimerase
MRLQWQDQVVIVDKSDKAISKIRSLWPSLQVRVGDSVDLIEDRPFVSRFSGIVVALPNSLHEQAVCDSLRAGLDVLCEKPLGNNADSCIRMAAAAERCGRKLAVGMVRRFLPSIRVIGDAILSGLLGEVQTIRIEHGGSFHWASESGSYFRKENGGIFLNMGIHYLDIIETWVGPLIPIEYRDDGESGVEANCVVLLRAKGGAEVSIRLSYTHQLANHVYVRGTRGEIKAGIDAFASAKWRSYDAGFVGELQPTNAFSVDALPRDFISSFAEQFVRFAEVITGRAEPCVTASQAASTHRTIDWGYSHRSPLFAPKISAPVRPSLSPMRTVVTGGSGFLGGSLVERLCELGFDDIIVPVRSYQSGADVARFSVNRVLVDLLDRHSVRRAIAGARYIFHLAYGTSGADAARVTIEATKNIVDAAIEEGAEALVIVSTASVFGHPKTTQPINEAFPYRPSLAEYGRSKVAAEKYALHAAKSSSPTRIVVINPAGIYGPKGRLFVEFPARAAIAGQFAWVDGGLGKFNYTFVENIVDALLLSISCSDAHGQNFIISDGVCSFREYFIGLLGPLANSIPSYSSAQLVDLERESQPSWRDLIRELMNDEVMRAVNGIPSLRGPKRFIERRLPKIYEHARAGRAAMRRGGGTTARERSPRVAPASWLANIYGPIDVEYSSERARRVLGWSPLVSLDAGLENSRSWLSAMGITNKLAANDE